MTNKTNSRQHCLVGNKRPVKNAAKKANKAANRERQKARQEAILAVLSPKKELPKTAAKKEKKEALAA